MPGLDPALLLPRLNGLTLRDAERLRSRLDALATADPARQAAAFVELAAAVAGAEQRIMRREAGRPVVTYPDLPVTARRADILAAMAAHQVVVVAGETGSGKTTQLPKMLLEQGRGIRGTIGHTQPRRIAARAVAERLAEELGVALGEAVGYTVRFSDTAGDRTLIRVMTDGVLLAEIHDDPLLLRYDALIIDEAHERSLTIDMLLGYLTRLLPQRPDLSVVITSATIDPQRFAEHFGGAPIIEVSGRTYPVEIRYRPWATPEDDPDEEAEGTVVPAAPRAATTPPDAEERDQPDAVVDAVLELFAEGPGDVLVFCSGEREIREAAQALTDRIEAAAAGDRRLAGTEIVPLYARLSAAEQHRVFAPHGGRRVVIATNVAETSLTVPGIRYVVDTGTARISRYSRRTKVQRLPIEAISKASARQRSGRCGRVADGVCIRLYAESDFEARPEFTEPEILRTNLASVVLRMAALDVGAVEDFPFVDPPDRRAVRDAVLLLEELHAVVPSDAPRGAPVAPELTAVGRLLSRLPVDPRLGRMLVEAQRLGCLDELSVLVAAMSIVDPRERPRDAPEAAEAAHRRFVQPDSDLLTLLALWRYLDEQRRERSGGAFRRLCKAEFLNHRRVREWIDLVAQLRTSGRELGWRGSSVGLVAGEAPAGGAADLVHQAALAGLLSHVGVRFDTDGGQGGRTVQDYLGARGARFSIATGSALGRKRPRWVMAAELVETSRLFARTVAMIEPGWVEAAAGDLAIRTYSEPRWDRRRAQIVATERVSLYGLPLAIGRRVGYGGIDATAARELFIRHALVEDEWETHHSFVAENRRRLAQANEREERTRRRHVVAGENERFAFFDERLPTGIVSGGHFDRWWRTARRDQPDLLSYDPAWLLRTAAEPEDQSLGFPDRWVDADAGLDLPASYRFAPGAPDDGVTIDIALAQLNRLRPAAAGWLVPGLRQELMTELIRSLPKSLRRSFAPAPDHAGAALQAMQAAGRVGRDDPLTSLAQALTAMGGPVVSIADFDLGRLPEHLRLRIRVLDADGGVLAEGRDLAALQQLVRGRQRDLLAELSQGVERRGLTDWTIVDLAVAVSVAGVDGDVVAYPAVVDEGGSAGVRVFATPQGADAAMPAGVARLLMLTIPSPIREVVADLPITAKLALAAPPGGDTAALLADCVAAGVQDLLAGWAGARGMPRSREQFDAARNAVRAALPATVAEIVPVVARVLGDAAEAEAELGALTRRTRSAAAAATADGSALAAGVADVRTNLGGLLAGSFVSRAGRRRLPDLVRYVAAARRRVTALAADPQRDAAALARWQVAQGLHAAALAQAEPGPVPPPALTAVGWMLQEYRVSLFAQQIRTAHPVSEQRIRKAIAAATRDSPSVVS